MACELESNAIERVSDRAGGCKLARPGLTLTPVRMTVGNMLGGLAVKYMGGRGLPSKAFSWSAYDCVIVSTVIPQSWNMTCEATRRHVNSCSVRRDADEDGTHHLIVIGDQVGDGRTGILYLNPPIGGKGEQGQRAVVVQLVSAVLPENERRDTTRVGGVGIVSILSLFKVAVVGAAKPSGASEVVSNHPA